MNNNDNNKTEPSKQVQSGLHPVRDEQGKQASGPTKGDADTAKREASGTGGAASSTDSSAK